MTGIALDVPEHAQAAYVETMDDALAVDDIRRHALAFLLVLDDPSRPLRLREFASGVVARVLWDSDVRGERIYGEIFSVLRRAIDREDAVPLVLLRQLDLAIASEPLVGAAVVRLGEHALGLGRHSALAQITRALSSSDRDTSCDEARAPAHWIRALVGDVPVAEAGRDVIRAVAAWLHAESSDLDAVLDVIPDPAAWFERDAECF